MLVIFKKASLLMSDLVTPSFNKSPSFPQNQPDIFLIYSALWHVLLNCMSNRHFITCRDRDFDGDLE